MLSVSPPQVPCSGPPMAAELKPLLPAIRGSRLRHQNEFCSLVVGSRCRNVDEVTKDRSDRKKGGSADAKARANVALDRDLTTTSTIVGNEPPQHNSIRHTRCHP